MGRLADTWPMRRDSKEFMDGFQRGYAEALHDVAHAGADALDGAEAMREMGALIESPIERARRWVREDDGTTK